MIYFAWYMSIGLVYAIAETLTKSGRKAVRKIRDKYNYEHGENYDARVFWTVFFACWFFWPITLIEDIRD